MKKIISGKRYDTETAKEVGSWSNGYYGTDFKYEGEVLYRKRGGEYFLYGEGNAASRYAEAVGSNSWAGGWRIMPLSYNEAAKWAETHLDADEYEAEFGEVPEDDSDQSVVLSVRVSPAAKAALDRATAQTGRSKGDIVSELLLAL